LRAWVSPPANRLLWRNNPNRSGRGRREKSKREKPLFKLSKKERRKSGQRRKGLRTSDI
jgi:hypothetical protein